MIQGNKNESSKIRHDQIVENLLSEKISSHLLKSYYF